MSRTKLLSPNEFPVGGVVEIRWMPVDSAGAPDAELSPAGIVLRRASDGYFWDPSVPEWVETFAGGTSPGTSLAVRALDLFTAAQYEVAHSVLDPELGELTLHVIFVGPDGSGGFLAEEVEEIRIRSAGAQTQIGTPDGGVVADPVQSWGDLFYALKVFLTHNRLIHDADKQEQFMQADGTTVAMSFDLKDAGDLPSVREVFKKTRDV